MTKLECWFWLWSKLYCVWVRIRTGVRLLSTPTISNEYIYWILDRGPKGNFIAFMTQWSDYSKWLTWAISQHCEVFYFSLSHNHKTGQAKSTSPSDRTSPGQSGNKGVLYCFCRMAMFRLITWQQWWVVRTNSHTHTDRLMHTTYRYSSWYKHTHYVQSSLVLVLIESQVSR